MSNTWAYVIAGAIGLTGGAFVLVLPTFIRWYYDRKDRRR